MGRNVGTEYEVIARPRMVNVSGTTARDMVTRYLAGVHRVKGFRFTMEDIMFWARYMNEPLTMPAARRELSLRKDFIRSHQVKRKQNKPMPYLDPWVVARAATQENKSPLPGKTIVTIYEEDGWRQMWWSLMAERAIKVGTGVMLLLLIVWVILGL